MNPVLLPFLAAAGDALRRRGWFPLAVFLAHETAAHLVGGYARWPRLDIPLHFLGGWAIVFFADGLLLALAARRAAPLPHPVLRLALLAALACAAAVFWEFAEWLADRYLGTRCQIDNDDTLGDLALGVLGGFAGSLPRLPAGTRALLRPVPETQA